MKAVVKVGVTLIANDLWLRDKSDDTETFTTCTKNHGVNNHFGGSISKFPSFSSFPSFLMFNPTLHVLNNIFRLMWKKFQKI